MKQNIEIKIEKGQITSKEIDVVIKILDKASDFYFIPALHSSSGKTVNS